MVKLIVHIRWFIRRDLQEALAIEQGSSGSPWCEEEFLRVLGQRNAIGMVAEYGEKVVGFMIYELHGRSLRVLRFAVHPEFRRQGVGHQMASKLIGKLSSHRRHQIELEVRDGNLDAQLFWKAQAFRATEVIRSHYDNGDDAYVMRYALEDHSIERETTITQNEWRY